MTASRDYRLAVTDAGLVYEKRLSGESVLHPTNPNFDSWGPDRWVQVAPDSVPSSVQENLRANLLDALDRPREDQ